MTAPETDAALVGRLVAAQFPQWAHLPVEQILPGGHDNRTFRLGDELSVRVPSAAHYAEHVAIEHEWLPKLRSHLPLPIPEVVGQGRPCVHFPWPWTVLRWLPGRSFAESSSVDVEPLARDLADFLKALADAPHRRGPLPGAHNFHRGGDLAIYDEQTRTQIARLGSPSLRARAERVWQDALAARDATLSSWVHGDVAAGNLLIRRGRLAAVIDFGQLAVGDPACDYVALWTLFEGESREIFRGRAGIDAGAAARARGWALWKELLALESRPSEPSRHLLDLLED